MVSRAEQGARPQATRFAAVCGAFQPVQRNSRQARCRRLVVRGTGGYERKAVLSTERKELQLRFRDGVQLSAYEFVVPSERRNRLKLVRINFKPEP